MFLIHCPYCDEKRDQSEFSYAHEAHIQRPEWRDDMSDTEWAEFVFMRRNSKGVYAERWVHSSACRRYFNMLRNTANDKILAAYKIDEKPPEIVAHLPVTPSGEIVGSGNDAVKVAVEQDGDER